MITPEKLKEIRFKNNDMSQQELADILGVSKQYISDLERGKSPISLNFEKKILEKGLIIPEPQQNEHIKKISELIKANPENTRLILDTVLKETDLMLLAAKAINKDKTALDRFIKLVG